MTESVELELSEPIHVVGEMRSKITLRAPNGGMLARAGSYARFVNLDTGETAVEPIPAGILKLIAACAGIPQRSVEMMTGPDFQRAQEIVMGFLAPSQDSKTETTSTASPAESPPALGTTSSTDTSNAQDGGATSSTSST